MSKFLEQNVLSFSQAECHQKRDFINTPAIVSVVTNWCWQGVLLLLLPENQMSEFTSAVETPEH